MPDLTRTVQIIFGADDQLTRKIRTIENDFNKFGSGVQSIANPLNNFTNDLLKADAALLTIGATLGGYAFVQANKFSAAQADLRKVIDESDGPVEQFNDRIFELSNRYGVAATSILESSANFKQAGFSVEDSFKLVKNSLDLVVAGDIEAAEASEILISALKGFNAPASEAARLVDILNEVSNKYATNVSELGQGMAVLAPIAKTTNLSFEETAGILTPIIEVFRSGNEAAIALKTGLLRLVSDNATVTSALKSIGVAQKDANEQLRPAKDILFDVQKAFAGLDQNTKLYIASQLTGIQQSARLVALFDNQNKSMAVTKTAYDQVNSAAKEVAIRLADAEIVVTRAGISFQNLGIAIGQKFNVGLADAVGGLGTFAAKMQETVNSGGLDPLFDAIKPQLDEFKRNVEAAAEVLPEAFSNVDFSGLIDSFDDLSDEIGDVFSNLFGDFDLTTVEGMQQGIQNVVNIITALVNVTKGIISELQPIFEGIGNLAGRTGEAGEAAQEAAGRLLGAMKVLSTFGTVLGSAVVIIQESGTDINRVFDVLTGASKIFINSLQVAFDAVALTITRTLEKIYSAASTVTFGDLSKEYKKTADDLKLLGDGIEANLNKNANEARDGIDQIGQGFGLLEQDAKKAGDSTSESTKKISDATKDAESAIKDAEKAIKDMSGASEGLVDSNDKAGLSTEKLAEAVKKYGDNFKVVNGEVVPGLKEIANQTENASASTGTFIKAIKDGEGKIIGYSDGVGGIGTKFKEVGKQTKEAEKKTEEFLTKMEQIASNERIKNIEFAVKLNIAQIESDTKKFEAVFDSINQTIGSTEKIISSAVGQLSSFIGVSLSDTAFKLIQKQLETENEARKDAFELQKKLTEAEINNINQKTKALKEGGGLIKISAEGLEPEIEAFMWKILKKIQIRGNENLSEFLLGTN